MGLDQELRRRYKPKDFIEKAIKDLDFGKEEEYTEILYWRKDYNINEFFEGIENCEDRKLSKSDLINFLAYLQDSDGKEDKHWKGETHDYTKEIKILKEIIETYDDESYVYYYWAWW